MVNIIESSHPTSSCGQAGQVLPGDLGLIVVVILVTPMVNAPKYVSTPIVTLR